ncbi:hypothetical protein [Pseudomonas sp. dw_358]|uniref:hypothetical protein n=1 Tax=Pseudomonas sp. dw_358 TaxID=2720083 RepID=UPI001BD43BE6|nr:hypothetical protein [Pseudomonas sp. dw_358]
MKVGVGVITMGLRPIRDYKLAPGSHLYVYTDTERKGPARARNQVLKYLCEEGCDVFFVFDDDCYPTVPGWEAYFLDQHQKTGIHLFGLPDVFHAGMTGAEGEVIYWNGMLVQFAMYTRKLLEEVGFYNTRYDRYGHEDSGYTFRALRSGLAGNKTGFPSPIRTLGYIHSEDVYGQTQVHNLTGEEKGAYIEANRAILYAELNGDQIYYPFAQDAE